MGDFFKYWALGTLISMCLGLYGCGNDTVPLEETNNEYSSQQLSAWKSRCIDDNGIRVEEAYFDCEELTPHFDCAANRLINYEKLEIAWNNVLMKADADLKACLSDYRAQSEFCYGIYDQDISFYVGLYCDGAL